MAMKPDGDGDGDDERVCWANLQSDLRNLIYSQLLDFDCIRFHLTCKEWQLAIKIPIPTASSSMRIHELEDSAYSSDLQLPWLVFFSNSNSNSKSLGLIDFFHPISNQTYTMQIPELADSTFRCSKYGWLLMSRGNHSFFFYNPFIPKCRGRIINLPDLYDEDFLKGFVSMSFTLPPTSPDCIVFAHKYFRSKIYTYRCGEDDDWTGYDIDYVQPFKASHNTPVFRQGVFYQLDVKGRLGAYDMMKKLLDGNGPAACGEDLMKPIEPNIVSYHKNYIAECDGELVSVFVGRKGDPIHVFKLDWFDMEWVMVESLDNKTMFITEVNGCLLVPTKANGTTKNKIYFPMFFNNKDGDEVNIFYSLETRRYHAFGTDFCSEDWSGTGALQNCVWIEPNVNTNEEVLEDNCRFNRLQDNKND